MLMAPNTKHAVVAQVVAPPAHPAHEQIVVGSSLPSFGLSRFSCFTKNVTVYRSHSKFFYEFVSLVLASQVCLDSSIIVSLYRPFPPFLYYSEFVSVPVFWRAFRALGM